MNNLIFKDGKDISIKTVEAELSFENVIEVWVEDCFCHIRHRMGDKYAIMLNEKILFLVIQEQE